MAVKVYKIRHDSKEYLPVKVDAKRSGDTYDPTSDTVIIALPVVDIDPLDGDYQDASWETITEEDGVELPNPEYYARILVGPGTSFELAKGDYDIIVKITDSPEVPVLRAGLLRIT